MAQIISFISGKGGCGKTTLALSMAKTLSDCNYTVLCIDCDLATNGATYFFENYYKHPVTTLSDILTYNPAPGFRNDTDELGRRLWEEQERQKLGPFDVEGFYFVPTATQYPSSNDDESKWHYENLEAYILTASKKFDVIICDCQAGYTKAMETVLSVSTIDVIIAEADPVSGSAVRVLRERITNSKVPNQLRNRNWSPYLLQNKVRLKFEKNVIRFERDVVNIEGTLYRVLPYHLDRDSVYEAFANLQIPNLDDCGVKYAEEILRFCKAVLSLKNEDCKAYQNKILKKRRKEAESGSYDARIERRNLVFWRNIWCFWLIIGCAFIIAPTGLLGIGISFMPSGMSVNPVLYTLMILAPVLSGMWLALFAMQRIISWNFRISKIREKIDGFEKMKLGL